MDGMTSIFRLEFLVSEKCQHLLNMRYLSNRYFGININGGGLCFGDRREGSDLTIIEAGRLSVVLQSYISGVYSVELCQSSNSIVPPITKLAISDSTEDILYRHFCPFGRCHVRHSRIFNDPSI